MDPSSSTNQTRSLNAIIQLTHHCASLASHLTHRKGDPESSDTACAHCTTAFCLSARPQNPESRLPYVLASPSCPDPLLHRRFHFTLSQRFRSKRRLPAAWKVYHEPPWTSYNAAQPPPAPSDAWTPSWPLKNIHFIPHSKSPSFRLHLLGCKR